jgi:Fe-S oxidoreductase
VKVCEYLKHYGRYPRKYLREVYNNLSIVKGTRYANQFINSCALCGLCGEVCPEGLDMASVIRPARQQMVAEKRMPPSAHDFALRDMAFSQSDKFSLARHQPGTATSRYVFFPGCQLSASRPGEVEKIYNYLTGNLNGGVGLMLGCCGAPADWAGRPDLFATSLTEFKEKHNSMDKPTLVLACSSCYQVFKTNLPEVEIVSLWEVLDEYGLPPETVKGDGRTVAIHDPCTARHERGVQDSARNIVQQLGYQIEELKFNREKTVCCSYGGHMWVVNPEVGRKVVDRRIGESPRDYVSYCAMCRDFFAGRGKASFHLLDLIYGGPTPEAAGPGPNYSERHENRARLKEKLLKELWEETMDGQQPFESIKLVISSEVQERLDTRFILIEDIQRVIEYAERSGARLLNRKTGRYLAYHKPTSVTYWVEYAPQAEEFVIYNAYSHRMDIGGSAVL